MSKLTTEFVELPDIKLAIRQAGEGPALILLHGNSGSKSQFKRYQLEYFRDYHTIAVDSRGHGESISTDESYSINQYSDDIIGLCQAMGIQQAYVIGYSDGGNICLFLAKKAPHIFTKIIAISPNYLVSGTTDGSLKLFQSAYKIFRLAAKLGINTKKPLMRFQLMLEDIGISDEDLKSIHANMMILYAEKDMIKEDHILQMGHLIPDVRVQKIDDCTHLSIINKPAAIEAMRQYLVE
ncbi:MAG: alpha/beta hydrolase [Anaerolineales bacterium]|nr:alpha/beta hydrolase [Anaerolineales bacterium]